MNANANVDANFYYGGPYYYGYDPSLKYYTSAYADFYTPTYTYPTYTLPTYTTPTYTLPTYTLPTATGCWVDGVWQATCFV